jgi:hypothetical protein
LRLYRRGEVFVSGNKVGLERGIERVGFGETSGDVEPLAEMGEGIRGAVLHLEGIGDQLQRDSELVLVG